MLLSKIRKQTKTIMWIFAVFFGVSIFYLFGTGKLRPDKDQQAEKKVSKYILEVDGEKVPRTLYEFMYSELRNMYERAGMPANHSYKMEMFIRARTAQQIVLEELLLREAKQRRVKISSGEVNGKIKAEQESTVGPPPALKNAGLPARISFFFAAKKKGTEFKQQLAQRGISYSAYTSYVRRRLIIEKVQKAKADELAGAENKKVQAKAMNAWKKLRAGEQFPIIAMQLSEDPSAEQNGGFWGWKTRADLDQALSARVFNMKIGDFSEPVKTNLGFQIVRVEAREEATGPQYEAERENIRKRLEQERGKGARVTEREIKRAYEKVLLSHILFQAKDGNALVGEWAQKQIDGKKIKYKVLDPELNAFMELQKVMYGKDKTQAALDKVLDLYSKALAKDTTNFQIYAQMGEIYEQKNTLLNEELNKKPEDKKGKKEAADPYEDSKTKAKSPRFLKEALESYQKAYDKSMERGLPDVEIIIGAARVNKALGEAAKDKGRKYRAAARRYYREAIDYVSSDNMNSITEIEEGLKELKDTKGLKEVKEVKADLESQTGAPEETMPPMPEEQSQETQSYEVKVGDEKNPGGEAAETKPGDAKAPAAGEKAVPETKPVDTKTPAPVQKPKPAAKPKPVAPKTSSDAKPATPAPPAPPAPAPTSTPAPAQPADGN